MLRKILLAVLSLSCLPSRANAEAPATLTPPDLIDLLSQAEIVKLDSPAGHLAAGQWTEGVKPLSQNMWTETTPPVPSVPSQKA